MIVERHARLRLHPRERHARDGAVVRLGDDLELVDERVGLLVEEAARGTRRDRAFTCPAFLRVYLPLSTPLLSGDHGVMPRPSSRAIGTSSCSTVRSSSEYSICSPMNADQPRKRAVTFASATFHAGVSETPR